MQWNVFLKDFTTELRKHESRTKNFSPNRGPPQYIITSKKENNIMIKLYRVARLYPDGPLTSCASGQNLN